jgi:hypothetical protein
LNAIEDSSAKLLSLDRFVVKPVSPNDPNDYFEVGSDVVKVFPDYKRKYDGRWSLIAGKDPSEVMEELNTVFDFAVIDTAHYHPVESLNFLSILPWLKDGAVVVLHDITNYLNSLYSWGIQAQYAPRLLFSSVCAEKIMSKTLSYCRFPNIGAFQVSPDTRKYIQNVFDALMLPWERYPKEDVNSVKSVYRLIKNHYTEKQIATFEEAVRLNDDIKTLEEQLKALSGLMLRPDTIFYGASIKFRAMIKNSGKYGWRFDYRIWDINAEHIGDIDGRAVTAPDFVSPAKPGQLMVIMIENEKTAREVRDKFEPLGYTVYHMAGELIEALNGQNPL